MHPSLHPAWRRAVLHVRQLAVQQCGVPQMSAEKFMNDSEDGKVKSKREVSPAYVISGAVPSADPEETIGNDVNVPFMFWMAVCCVKNANGVFSYSNSSDSDSDTTIDSSNHHFEDVYKQKHVSFAIYARNNINHDYNKNDEFESGSQQFSDRHRQVMSAPVVQLEELLEDIHKTATSTDTQVTLFPGSRGACSDLSSDISARLALWIFNSYVCDCHVHVRLWAPLGQQRL